MVRIVKKKYIEDEQITFKEIEECINEAISEATKILNDKDRLEEIKVKYAAFETKCVDITTVFHIDICKNKFLHIAFARGIRNNNKNIVELQKNSIAIVVMADYKQYTQVAERLYESNSTQLNHMYSAIKLENTLEKTLQKLIDELQLFLQECLPEDTELSSDYIMYFENVFNFIPQRAARLYDVKFPLSLCSTNRAPAEAKKILSALPARLRLKKYEAGEKYHLVNVDNSSPFTIKLEVQTEKEILDNALKEMHGVDINLKLKGE